MTTNLPARLADLNPETTSAITLAESLAQRREVGSHHLNVVWQAIHTASLQADLIDDDGGVPAMSLLAQVEPSLFAVNDLISELEAFGNVASASLDTLRTQRDQVVDELEATRANIEKIVAAQVEERIDEALLEQIASAEELEVESIRSIAEEIISADFDFESIRAEKLAELERTLRAARQVAEDARTQWGDDDDDAEDEGDDEAEA